MRYSFVSGVNHVSKVFIWPCSVMLATMTILVFVGVIFRYVFNAPIRWVPETVQFLFGGIWLLTGAALIATREHTRVDILVNRFSRRTQAIFECFISPVVWLFIGALLYYSADMAWDSLKVLETAGTFWAPPIWPIKLTLAVGVFLMFLQSIANFISDFKATARSSRQQGQARPLPK